MPRCLIGFGSNLGDRQATLEAALGRLAQHEEVRVVARSSWRETTPVGGPTGQGAFLNGVALLETSLAPDALLALLLDIEIQLGRVRMVAWGPRTLDLDLLLFDQLVLQTPTLVVPHPRMAWRRFVLEPAVEIAAELVHPILGWTLARLLRHLNTAFPYLAIAGSIGAGKSRFAQRLAQRQPVRQISEFLDSTRMEWFYRNPAGNAWEMELKLLGERTSLLSAGGLQGSEAATRWTVSDFWFDQSWAFASVWLPAARRAEFFARWEEARRRVTQPKLTVLLDPPVDRLLERIAQRGRPWERGLTAEVLGAIREALLREIHRPDRGPVLHLNDPQDDRGFEEVLAALSGMGPGSGEEGDRSVFSG